MRGLCRALDWGATPLGPVESWPAALHAAVRLCLDSGFAMCVYAGPEHVLLYNDGFVRALGNARHPAALGRPAREVWAEIWGQIGSELAGVLGGGPPVHREDQRFVLDRDGESEETFWTYAFSPVREDDGAIVGLHSVVTETTSRVRAEAALHRGEARQAFLLKLSDALRPLAKPRDIQAAATKLLREQFDAGWCYYVEWNEAGTAGEVLQDATREGLPSLVGRHDVSDVPEYLELLKSVPSLSVPDFAGFQLLTPRIREHYTALGVRAFLAASLVKGGRSVAVLVLAETQERPWPESALVLIQETAERIWATLERARAEAALRESEERLALIFTQATVGLSEVSADGRFLKNNAELRRILGRTPEEMATLSVADVTHPESIPASHAALQRVFETGEPALLEKRYLRPDGTPVWAESSLIRLGGSAGLTPRALVVTVELTLRREAEAALRQSEESSRALAAQAGQRAELAQQLVGIVSHDLGSPLAALRLSAEALSGSRLDERQMAALGRIRTSAEWAMRLTKDLLDFTQVRLGGGLRIHPHALDLEACVRRVLEEVQASFPGRRMRLHCEGNARGVWDGDRMAQVVTNLVNNAAKYSPSDTPISVRLYTQRHRMVLEVHNQGRAIPAGVRERLFEPMRRGTLDVDPTGRSVGLGLFIVKHIVDAHGGTLQVKSSAREGTTFTVRLPRATRVKA